MEGTTTTTSDGSGDEQWGAGDPATEQPQLLATAVGDQCSNCGARLAGDQRYCVECGQRRGKPRYPLASSGTSSPGMAYSSGGGGRPRLTANSTLIAGIATLLLAMGVGVLIGRSSNGSSGRQIVTVQGGAPAASSGTPTTSTPTTASTPTSTTAGTSTTGSSSTAKPKSSGAAAALSSKLPTKAKTIPKSLKSQVAKPGSKCTSGEKGCTGGKFTGTFFGGG